MQALHVKSNMDQLLNFVFLFPSEFITIGGYNLWLNIFT